MLQTRLLIFSGISAVISMAFIAFARNLSHGFNSLTKKTIFTLLMISFLNVAIAFGVTYILDTPSGIFWGLCGVFLVFGVVHVFVAHPKFIPSPGENKYVVLSGEVFFAVAVMFCVAILTSLLEYYIRDKGFMFYPLLLAMLSFLVPLFFYYSYDAGDSIPVTDFPVWEYPVSKRIDPPDESLNENLLVIGFNISKRVNDKKTVFRAKAPENILLGELFYHFINEYNEEKTEVPIDYLDENKEPIIWWFRLKRKWYQFNTVLDPSLRIRDNMIKENSVIVCEQLLYKPVKVKAKQHAR